MLAKFITRLVAHRRLSLLIIFAVAVATLVGATRLTVELTGREFFAHREDDVARLAEFVERWGGDSNVLVAIADARDGIVLTRPRMLAMARLARTIRDIDGVNGAWSLQEFPRFQSSATGTAQLAIILGTAPSDASELLAWQTAQLADPLLVPGVLSQDGRYAALVIELDDHLDTVSELSDPVNAIAAAIDASQGIERIRWELTGLPAIRVALLEVVVQNKTVLVPLSMLLVIGLLAFIYRRQYAVLLPLVAGMSSVAVLLGIMGWTGEPVGLLNQFYFTLIPVIVMVDGVHVIERFAHEAQTPQGRTDVVKAVVATYASVGTACFLTSLTTAIGFVSLGLANIAALRHFGFYAALGVLLGFALIVTIVPLTLVRVGQSEIRRSPIADKWLHSLARVAIARPGQVCAIAALVFLGLSVLATRVESGSRLTGDLPVGASASVGGGLLDSHLSGLFRFDIVLEGSGLDTYGVLRKIDDLESRWRKNPALRTVLGPGTAVRHASRWVDAVDSIPIRDDVDDYYLELLRFSELPPVLSADGKHARIVITAPDRGTSEMLRLGRQLVDDARQVLGENKIAVGITGEQWNLYLGYAGIGRDLRNSILFALAAIMIVMALLFRSGAVPILMLLPNALPLLAGYAALAVVGWQLGIVPAVVLALAVGIVVDDSIHMLARMREEMRRGQELTEAVKIAVMYSGRAIVMSTLVLVAGFAINGFSEFPINQAFALIGSVVLISALLCDVVLLPALFILWNRRYDSFRTD